MTAADFDTARLTEATARLRAAAELVDHLAPLRRVITDADEELRAAMLQAADAGLSERAIAAQTGQAQPTVNRQLDGRRGGVTPPPPLHEVLWSYHRIASGLATLVLRLEGRRDLPDRAPSNAHVEPRGRVTQAATELEGVAQVLGHAAAAAEFSATAHHS
ncbi:hypothetical protein GT755_38040 [Herbidospora sp. NEAU-GS84]|uniref:Uncharacterized protein n=1 Tax=Herbidospora solisilvae TaxID=2696284 RepID=A0A7C9NTH2_9ACTN|nr:hypothetical protein [Herbidospora solisilvae]NAS27456.1 hypothetical protein [Herbidospora solisilvae]